MFQNPQSLNLVIPFVAFRMVYELHMEDVVSGATEVLCSWMFDSNPLQMVVIDPTPDLVICGPAINVEFADFGIAEFEKNDDLGFVGGFVDADAAEIAVVVVGLCKI